MKFFSKNRFIQTLALSGGLIIMSSAMAVVTFKNDDEKFSYLVGHQIASSIISDPNLKFDRKLLVKALEDGLDGKKSDIDPKDAQAFMGQYMATKQKVRSEQNLKEGQSYLAKNKSESGVVTLPSGLQYKVAIAGKGAKPKATDTVTVDYEGTLVNGTVFDSSYKRGEPVSFPVSGVIKGWTEALQLMPEGSTWNLYIPANLAYGEQSPSQAIGPNSTLVFKVHLISVAKPAETTTPKQTANPKEVVNPKQASVNPKEAKK